MTWTKTSDDFPDRLFDLSSDAYRLHHAATTFANRMLLDGRIPKSRLQSIAVPRRVSRAPVIYELIDAGLWVDDGDAWILTDFLADQLTKDEVLAIRKYDAVRKRMGFATTKAAKADLRAESNAARDRLFAARERHKALISRGDPQGDSPRDTHRESHRSRSDPSSSRPAPMEDEDEEATPSTRRLKARSGVAANSVSDEPTVDADALQRVRKLTAGRASLKMIVEGTGLLKDPAKEALGVAGARVEGGRNGASASPSVKDADPAPQPNNSVVNPEHGGTGTPPPQQGTQPTPDAAAGKSDVAVTESLAEGRGVPGAEPGG